MDRRLRRRLRRGLWRSFRCRAGRPNSVAAVAQLFFYGCGECPFIPLRAIELVPRFLYVIRNDLQLAFDYRNVFFFIANLF